MDQIITDQKLVNQLIEQPLKSAKADPRPAEYVIIGSVNMKRKDGSYDGLFLFAP